MADSLEGEMGCNTPWVVALDEGLYDTATTGKDARGYLWLQLLAASLFVAIRWGWEPQSHFSPPRREGERANSFMLTGRCLVYERTGVWAMALRRELSGAGPRLVETRTWDQFLAELAEAPASVACVESAGLHPDEWVRRLAHLHDDFPLARVVMLAERGASDCEPVWRDLGVVEVARSRRDLAATALIVRRHVRTTAADESLRAQLFRDLPWADVSEDSDEGRAAAVDS